MTEISELQVDTPTETPTDTPTEQPKRDLADICKRYMESQKELMEVIVALLIRLEKIEKVMATPLLG